MNRKIYSIFVAIIITIVLLAILFSQINFSDVIKILTKIKPIYLIAGFLFSLAGYLLRALRLYILLNREIEIKELFSIVCIHNVALSIFPARSGELSYIYLLNKRHNRTAGEGAASLVTVRIMDIITVSLFFLMSIILIHNLPAIVMNATRIIGIFLCFTVFFILMFIWNCDKFVHWLRTITIYLKLNENKIVNYLLNKLDEMSGTFKRITRRQFINSLIISIGIWIMLYLILYMEIKAMGIDISLTPFLLASTFFLMTSIIPVQGIGGFGTLEGGWAISFMAVGVMKDVAISSGIIMHIISIIYLILIFIIGFTGLREKTNVDK